MGNDKIDSRVVDGFCGLCRNIIDHWKEAVDRFPPVPADRPELHLCNMARFPYYKSAREITDSADEGCDLCTLIVTAALHDDHDFRKDGEEAIERDFDGGSKWYIEYVDRIGRYIVIDGEYIGQRKEGMNCEEESPIEGNNSDVHLSRQGFYMLVTQADQAAEPGDRNWSWRLCHDLSSGHFCEIVLWPALGADEPQSELERRVRKPKTRDDLVSLVKIWMKDCNDHHGKCSHVKEEHELPTRLLDISCQTIKLRTSLNLPRNTKYATLSHCWGSGEHIKLLNESLERFEKSIPRQQFSKTFEDAVFIASELGVKYLWIDSLCIIQDNAEDWRRESVSMSTVYGNSFLNIAAAGALDGSGGCIFIDNPLRFSKVNIVTEENGDQVSYNLAPNSLYKLCVSDTPLASRAWALQERLLAPRTIHFGTVQLFWECDEGSMCESLPYINRYYARLYSNHDQYLEKRALSDYWEKVICVYSRCRLTKAEDRFIAISGVIRKIQVQRNDICVAGLWKSNMEIELLWHITHSSARRDFELAPSWSWISVNGIVKTHDFYGRRTAELSDMQLYAHILDVDVKLNDRDPLNVLIGGSISLSCRTLIRARSEGFSPVAFKIESTSYATIDGFRKENLKIDGRSEIDTLWACWDYEQEPSGSIYLLPVKGSIAGLILSPTGREQGQYRRVGVFDSLPNTHNEIQGLREILMDPENFAGPEAFARSFVNTNHDGENWVLNIV